MSVLSDLSKCLYPPKAATVLNSSPTTCTLPISLGPQNISDISNTYRKICCLFHLLLKMKIKMYAEFFFSCSIITLIWKTEQQYLILDQQQALRVNTPQDMPFTLTYFT